MKKLIYLDYAASTPLDKDVFAAMKPYYTNFFYNPSSNNSLSKKILQDINDARKDVAMLLGCKPNEIYFLGGGSEANNLAIKGVMEQYPKGNILISSIEHESVSVPASSYSHQEIRVNSNGDLDLEDFKNKLNQNTILVSVILASNEIGVINKLSSVAEIIKKERSIRLKNKNTNPILLHSDASAAANYLNLNVHRLGVDLLTINGAKIYGPKGSAVLFIKNGTNLKPLIEGGGQEKGLRSGTLNTANIIGFAQSLKLTEKLRPNEEKRVNLISNYLIKELLGNPKISLNGPFKNRLANIINISIREIDNELLIYKLDNEGIIVSAGSACSASDNEPSHVLKAIGKNDDEIRSSIRISLGRSTTKDDIAVLIKTLNELIK